MKIIDTKTISYYNDKNNLTSFIIYLMNNKNYQKYLIFRMVIKIIINILKSMIKLEKEKIH